MIDELLRKMDDHGILMLVAQTTDKMEKHMVELNGTTAKSCDRLTALETSAGSLEQLSKITDAPIRLSFKQWLMYTAMIATISVGGTISAAHFAGG